MQFENEMFSVSSMAVESPTCLVVVLFTELPDQNTMINNSEISRSMLTCSDALRIGKNNPSEIKS